MKIIPTLPAGFLSVRSVSDSATTYAKKEKIPQTTNTIRYSHHSIRHPPLIPFPPHTAITPPFMMILLEGLNNRRSSEVVGSIDEEIFIINIVLTLLYYNINCDKYNTVGKEY